MTKTKVFGIYETSEQAGSAVDEFVRYGFEPGSIMVLAGDSGSSRDFAKGKHTRLPLIVSDRHGHDMTPDGNWGLLDPQCGPQEGSIFAALTEMEIPMEWTECAVLEGKILLSVDCINGQGALRITDILIATGAVDTGVSSTPHPPSE